MASSRAATAPALAALTAGIAAGGAVAAFELRKRRRRPRTVGDGRLIARWVLEEPWKGNWDVLQRHVSTAYVGQDLAESESYLGQSGLRARLERLVAAFPDGRLQVEQQIAEGPDVMTRWTLTGTQTGELAGLSPSGKQVTVAGITISRLAGDLVIEEWTSWDRLGLLVQLGAVSEPAHA